MGKACNRLPSDVGDSVRVLDGKVLRHRGSCRALVRLSKQMHMPIPGSGPAEHWSRPTCEKLIVPSFLASRIASLGKDRTMRSRDRYNVLNSAPVCAISFSLCSSSALPSRPSLWNLAQSPARALSNKQPLAEAALNLPLPHNCPMLPHSPDHQMFFWISFESCMCPGSGLSSHRVRHNGKDAPAGGRHRGGDALRDGCAFIAPDLPRSVVRFRVCQHAPQGREQDEAASRAARGKVGSIQKGKNSGLVQFQRDRGDQAQ